METRTFQRQRVNTAILAMARIALAFLYTLGGAGGTVAIDARFHAPAVTLSPVSLSFPGQAVGTSSVAQSVTLSDTGRAALAISSIVASGDFGQTNNCGTSVASGNNCTISVTFTPTATGTRTGTVTITRSGWGSPRVISLSGTGTAPVVSLSATSLPFGSQAVGKTSSPQTVTLSNAGDATLSITSITVTGANASDFGQTNTCGSSVAPGANCTISVTFTPIAVGVASGSLWITDNAADSPQTVSLTGTGTSGDGSADYYVSPAGSDSNSGSSASPWATIQQASSAISAGATVHVLPGTYAGNLLTNASGTSSARITYISDTPYGAKIVNSSWNGDLNQSVWDNEGSYVTIQGFDISGDAYQGIGNGGSNVLIKGNHVHDVVPQTCNGTGGAGINDHGSDSDDINNTVNDVGNFSLGACAYVHGIHASRTGGHIWNNLVYHNWSFGIQLWGAPSNITISSNTVFNNGNSGLVVGADSGSAGGMLVTNNIFMYNGDYGFEEEGSTGANSYLNNLTFSNGKGDSNLQTGTASGTIVASPLVVNYQADGGDDHLTSTSPAIDAGTPLGAPVYDLEGNARPQGSAFDIGAYEFISSAPPPAPVVSLSPPTLTFANQIIGTTSAAQTSILTNTGNAALAITGITTGSDFPQTSDCGSSVAAGANCTISVTFTPTAAGPETGAITISDNAANTPQTISLSGAGAAAATPAATLSPGSLTFASQTVGTTSGAQIVTLSNTGGLALTITSISTAAPFAQTNNCGSSLAEGGSCVISVTFTPTATGSTAGTLAVVDDASGSPHTVGLAGTGTSTAPVVSLSPTSLPFGNQAVGTTSSPQTVTLSNTGNTVLTITSIAVTGANASDFVPQTDNCGSSLAAGANCTIVVSLTPSAIGNRTASVSITDNASGSPHTVSLSGAGIHYVALYWTVSTTSGVGGYNVYRGTASGGPYPTQLNSSPIDGATYIDATVQAGQTYYYVARALASDSAVESANSNEASAAVPSP